MRTKSIALFAAATAAVLKFATGTVTAADVTWDNGSTDFLWNTSSLNWTGAAWNNAAGDGAIFGANGVGAISVPGAINVNSMSFLVDGYKLDGAGSITFVDGVSTWTTGVINVATLATAQVNVPLHSALGFQKIGPGVLELTAPGSFTGYVPLDARGTTGAGLLVGGSFGTIDGGTLRVGPGVLPASTRVGIGTGYLDIGANAVTIDSLTFTNQLTARPWNTTLNANNGVIGSGTLRVAGEINVLGAFGDNSSNTIASNVDLGGGTQVIRVGAGSQFTASSALIFSGSLHNGSLLKTVGYNPNGVQTTTDGMALFGNNTYTGPTILNGGQNVIAGTNQTSLIKVAGTFGAAAISVTTMFGPNGSAQNAGTIQSFAGSTFVLDNNASAGDSSLIFGPATPAAQNNDRIRDDAAVELRDGNITYRGLANAVASETYGSLNILGGHNVLTVTPNGTLGTASFTAAGNLTMAPRSTMLISAGTLLGDRARAYFNGTIPAADATGILTRIVSSNDFVTYSAATGMTPYTGYATDFSTAGTNVAIAAATTVASSVDINALKRTGSFTLTIAAGQTLGITSGMILNTSGTGTITGGTIAFGSAPGMLVGTNNISSAITGSAGLIHASGTGTLSGDLSGLSGSLDVYTGTSNLNTNTFAGPINVRNATLNLNVSQTGAGQGPITLGVAQNDENLLGTFPGISVSGAGANAVFNRDIVADNGVKSTAGRALRYNLLPGISVLSNTTGSQTFNGNLTLNTGLRIQGGGASNTSTGATVFNGNITGEGTLAVANGRVIFNGAYSNAGGFYLGDQGFSMKAFFQGTGSGTGSVVISGGNSNTVSYVNGGLPGGVLRVWNSLGSTAPQIFPLNDSTINNPVFLDDSPASGGGDATVSVGAGITATWAGPISGGGALTKAGAGALILSSNASTWTSPVAVSAGTLTTRGLVNHGLTSISAGATLEIGPAGPVGDTSATSNFREGLFSIAGGSTPTGKLDLNKNGAVFDYVNTSPEATIAAQIASGYAGGNWTGNGITSSDAADDVAGHAVGYALASDIGSPATFLGQSVDATSVLVRYTRQGDADLSGATDLADFSALGANFNLPGGWAKGDFNYDGTVGIADFSLLAANYNLAAAGGVSDRAGAVPEPASLGLLLFGAAATLRRSRRS